MARTSPARLDVIDLLLLLSASSFLAILLLPAATLSGSLDGFIGLTRTRIQTPLGAWISPFLDNLPLYTVPMLAAITVNVLFFAVGILGRSRGDVELANMMLVNLANTGYSIGVYRGLVASIDSIPRDFNVETSAGVIRFPPGTVEWNPWWELFFWLYVFAQIALALVIIVPVLVEMLRSLRSSRVRPESRPLRVSS